MNLGQILGQTRQKGKKIQTYRKIFLSLLTATVTLSLISGLDLHYDVGTGDIFLLILITFQIRFLESIFVLKRQVNVY